MSADEMKRQAAERAETLRKLGAGGAENATTDAGPEAADGKPRIVATYPYTDEHGELLYEVLRYEPKGFRQRRPNGQGGWAWNLNGARRVLYRLPALLADIDADNTVWICEGEKDAEALRSAGAAATCNSGGAATEWLPEYSGLLRDTRRDRGCRQRQAGPQARCGDRSIASGRRRQRAHRRGSRR